MPLGNFTRRGGGGDRPTDPQAIFDRLTLRGSVENLWGPQTAALAEWNQHRTIADITIEMPTGGGKTLIGLLVAQAITNEARGRVLYACPNNQLVEQTAAKASEVGLVVATYHDQTWTNEDAFNTGQVPCITSYASAFLAFRTSRTDGLEALILDDAHVAIGDLKSRFTLTITNKHPTFGQLKSILQGYAISAGRGGKYDEAIGGTTGALCFLPAFTTCRHAQEIQHLLLRHDINGKTAPTRFVWAYLADRLDRCLYFVAEKRIEIAAPLPSIDAVPSLANANRRVYLTATLPSPYEAARVLGNRTAVRKISPQGKLGAAQKMLAFVRGDDSTAQRAAAASLIRNYKACIIVPSLRDAGVKWPNIDVYSKDDGEEGLKQFRNATGPKKLVLAGRFDGIDLPGESCKVLVLDGLPRGVGLIDRFLAESIRSRELRASSTAVKIVQAIGRIFRSNNDHGAVIVVGDDIQRWLMDQHNQGFLPALLQQQVKIALDFREGVTQREYTFEELLRGVLLAEKKWDDIYNDNIASYPTAHSSFNAEVGNAFGIEHAAARSLWDGDFAAAAQQYREAANNVDKIEPALAGWFLHLAGLATMLLGDTEAATTTFLESAAKRSDFGRPSWVIQGQASSGRVGDQASRLNQLLAEPTKFSQRLELVLSRLTYVTPPLQVEDALCELGKLLGLDSERPDNTRRGPAHITTGPDVVWIAPWRNEGASFEAKTGKQPDGHYSKLEDIAKCHDHLQWLLVNKPAISFRSFIVGRYLAVVPEANPSLDLRIVGLDEFARLARQLDKLKSVALQKAADERGAVIHSILKLDGMLWPNLVEGLESRLALDLQSNPPEPDDAQE